MHFQAEPGDEQKELLKLCRELSDHTYRPGRSVCFFSEKPKLREIFAADFRDRIVHHILVNYLESIYEPVFIHDSYACRKGKGIHKGVARLRTFNRRVTANRSRRAWYQSKPHNIYQKKRRVGGGIFTYRV